MSREDGAGFGKEKPRKRGGSFDRGSERSNPQREGVARPVRQLPGRDSRPSRTSAIEEKGKEVNVNVSGGRPDEEESTMDQDVADALFGELGGYSVQVPQTVKEAWSDLPEEDQSMVRAVYVEGKSLRQVADDVGLSFQRVDQRVNRAVGHLKRHQEGFPEAEPKERSGGIRKMSVEQAAAAKAAVFEAIESREKTVKELAEEYKVSEHTIKNWRKAEKQKRGLEASPEKRLGAPKSPERQARLADIEELIKRGEKLNVKDLAAQYNVSIWAIYQDRDIIREKLKGEQGKGTEI